jgi:mRNA interferase RelE/StbE
MRPCYTTLHATCRYAVAWSYTALSLALDWPPIDAVEEALALLERDPTAGYELQGTLRGLPSLRVGSYRIVYQLSDRSKTVRVATVRHRSIVYRTNPR